MIFIKRKLPDMSLMLGVKSDHEICRKSWEEGMGCEGNGFGSKIESRNRKKSLWMKLKAVMR